MSVTVDERDWPVVRIAFAGDLTVDDESTYEHVLSDLLGRAIPFGVIEGGTPSGTGEKSAMIARLRFLHTHRALLGTYVAGIAVLMPQHAVTILEEAIADGHGSAMLKVISFPQRPFSRVEDAESWLRGLLRTLEES